MESLLFNSIVWDAAKHGNTDDLVIALASHPNLIDAPNEHQQTPLFVAAMKGHVSVIETLVRLGSNAIDTPTDYGQTPLSAAAGTGHVNSIETLVRLGSQAIDTPDKRGWTPMFYAARSGHANVVEALVRLGSNAVDIPGNNGQSPMFAAAARGHVRVIEMLFELGHLDIDAPAKDGNTMLHAARVPSSEAVEALVRLGSKAIEASNAHEYKPVELAAYACFCSRLKGDRESLARARRCTNALVALGATRILGRHAGHWLDDEIEPVEEDEVLDIRFRVYFAHSLTARLLTVMARQR